MVFPFEKDQEPAVRRMCYPSERTGTTACNRREPDNQARTDLGGRLRPSGTWPTKGDAGATATGVESMAGNGQSEEEGKAVKPIWQAAQALHLAAPSLTGVGEELSMFAAVEAVSLMPSCMAW